MKRTAALHNGIYNHLIRMCSPLQQEAREREEEAIREAEERARQEEEALQEAEERERPAMEAERESYEVEAEDERQQPEEYANDEAVEHYEEVSPSQPAFQQVRHCSPC